LAIVVVGGNAKDVGKTALVCGIISALREFAWTAVKITGHDYESINSESHQTGFSQKTIHEETNSGLKTDTGRYIAAGARRALLVTRHGAEVPIDEIKRALGGDRNVIFESNRIVDELKPDVCIALIARPETKVKESFSRLLRVADAFVNVQDAGNIEAVRTEIPHFQLQSLDPVSSELTGWLRNRISK
jgi:hypothetical protein